MLVDNVDLAARNGSRAINFGFRDPGNKLPYQVRSITGLDADEIVNSFIGHPTGAAGMSSFNLPRLVKREVSFLFGLNPDWSVSETFSDLRDDLYRLIGSCPSGQVQIRFNYGTSEDESHVKAVLLGRISKVEANHFVDRPEVQVTVSAEDFAMLESLWTSEIIDPLWVPQEEIEWVPSSSGEFVPNHAVKLVDEESTAPHGLEANFEFSGTESPLSMKFKMEGLGALTGLKFEVLSFPFEAGDLLHIHNWPDDRQVYVDRGTLRYHLVDRVTADSIWPIMYPGDNYYTWATNNSNIYGTASKASWTSVSWKSAFWGV